MARGASIADTGETASSRGMALPLPLPRRACPVRFHEWPATDTTPSLLNEIYWIPAGFTLSLRVPESLIQIVQRSEGNYHPAVPREVTYKARWRPRIPLDSVEPPRRWLIPTVCRQRDIDTCVSDEQDREDRDHVPPTALKGDQREYGRETEATDAEIPQERRIESGGPMEHAK